MPHDPSGLGLDRSAKIVALSEIVEKLGDLKVACDVQMVRVGRKWL